jgi:Arc/MetJ-type ribon-helix-helix transcriptional regulator
MKRTINISFPDDLYVYIQERADDGTYASTSEYIRALVREDRVRNEGKIKSTRQGDLVIRRANDVWSRSGVS